MVSQVNFSNPQTGWLANAFSYDPAFLGMNVGNTTPSIMGNYGNAQCGFTNGSNFGGFDNYGMSNCYGNFDFSTTQGRKSYIKMQKEMAQAQRAMETENTKSQIEQQKMARTAQFESQASDNQIAQILTNIHNAIKNDDKDLASEQ